MAEQKREVKTYMLDYECENCGHQMRFIDIQYPKQVFEYLDTDQR